MGVTSQKLHCDGRCTNLVNLLGGKAELKQRRLRQADLQTGDDTNYPQKGLNGVRGYRNLKSGKLVDCRQ